MFNDFVAWLALTGPALHLAASAVLWLGPGFRPGWRLQLAEAAALAAMLVAGAVGAALMSAGPADWDLATVEGWGLAIRVDPVSAVLFALVAFIGWIVVRYAVRNLDGEKRQGTFMAQLAAALAFVMLLVLSENMFQVVVAWGATTVLLHRLLLFFPERPAARRVAGKMAVVAIAGNMALVASAALLFVAFGTGDIGQILVQARNGDGGAWALASACTLAVAALAMSAQFPGHGWLTEVMETPTPVSALLHAGIINAGGMILIRVADVMLLAPEVLSVIAFVGGFTALLGAAVMLAQPAIKTSLAWSTVSQMGFMMLQCGLGLFALALLHIVAHSLYKAHAFLSSGEAVEKVSATRRPGPVAIPGMRAVLRAFLFAAGIYAVAALAFGIDGKPPQVFALGAILVAGVAYMIAQGQADVAPRQLTFRTAVFALATSVAYFTLQEIFARLTSGTLPPAPAAGPLEWTVMIVAVASFACIALLQASFPLWSTHPAASALRVHLANGFYANALFDRLTGSWRTPTTVLQGGSTNEASDKR